MCEDRTQNCDPERHPSKHLFLETNRLREQRHSSMIKLDMIQIVEF